MSFWKRFRKKDDNTKGKIVKRDRRVGKRAFYDGGLPDRYSNSTRYCTVKDVVRFPDGFERIWARLDGIGTINGTVEEFGFLRPGDPEFAPDDRVCVGRDLGSVRGLCVLDFHLKVVVHFDNGSELLVSHTEITKI